MEPPAALLRCTWRELTRAAIGFVVVVAAGNALASWLATLHPVDLPRWWPLGVFHRRIPSATDFAFAAGAWIVFEVAWKFRRSSKGGRWLPVAAVLVVLASTAAQGVPRGFEHPIVGLAADGQAIQYAHDAERFAGATDLFARWNAEQDSLRVHSRTHPPGAVLLTLVSASPAVLGVLWLVVTTLVAAAALHALAGTLFARQHVANFGVLAFASLPAVQVYFGATIDAWVSAAVLTALALHVVRASPIGSIAAGLAFAFAALCSFGAWIAAPILVAAEFGAHRTVRRSAFLFTTTATVLLALRGLGFDYLESFATATRLENPGGFRLFVDPIGYAATRVEDIAEIAFFAGPALLFVSTRWHGALDSRTRWVVCTAIAALAAAFAVGAFKTGETARGCLFVAPLLLLPFLAAVERGLDDSDAGTCLRATLGFGLALQLFGDWFW